METKGIQTLHNSIHDQINNLMDMFLRERIKDDDVVNTI
jgi:hypothetical protein